MYLAKARETTRSVAKSGLKMAGSVLTGVMWHLARSVPSHPAR